jgi:sugar phosphate isomerase/epimerase
VDRLAIEFISVLGQPPIEFVEVAARLGCGLVGLACSPIVALPELYPAWTLRGNPALQRDVKQALADNGVALSLGEGFLIMAGRPIAEQAGDMDILAELGAPRLNVVSIEADRERARDEFALFCEMAAERGLRATIEYMPMMPIGTLSAAAQFATQSGKANAGVLVDAMHFYRSGSTAAELSELEPATIGYAQLCDVPLVSPYEDYSIEARFDRLAPGDGELPLDDFVRALPANCVVGLEVPMRDKALAGLGPTKRLRPAVQAARALLAH